MDEFDVIVLGTGAAGLAAVIAAHEQGARVGVFEKADLVGGTTAWSGGQIWIPNNPHQLAAGQADSRAEGVTHLASLARGMIGGAMGTDQVDNPPEEVAFLEGRDPGLIHSNSPLSYF